MNGKSAHRFSATDKRKALLRELVYRRFVFPRRVAVGKMSQREADLQIAIFEAMVEDYAEREEGERLL